jgi:predicted type IV restriction endonuclease
MQVTVMRPEENRRYIEELVRRYDDLGPSYRGGTFNEAQLRKEYIDVLFRALGWDVDNAQGYSESYKEVVHEDPIKLRGTTGHIDYSFRIGGVRKFIVETKKPAVNIRDDQVGGVIILDNLMIA